MPVFSPRSLPSQWAYPFGGAPSILRRIVRSVSAVYLRGCPGRGSSNNPSSPSLTKRLRHLQTRATRVLSLLAMSVLLCPSAPQRMICALSAIRFGVVWVLTNRSNSARCSGSTVIKENTAITPEKLGLASDDITGKKKIIDFIHGLDVYDENRNGIYDEKREWILGAFIHSRPLVIHYSNLSVIYAGANDGMLHAFNNGWPLDETNWHDGTGEELWAFIPPRLLPNL